MSNTKIKAAQFHGVVGHGTNGYFLVSDGNGGMSWVLNIINPTITNVDYPGTATAADPAGGETITLTGTGFKTGAAVTIGGTAAGSVSFVSATELTVTTPAKTAGDYDIVVTNTDGGSATSINGISYNGIPAWTTAAGSLGTFDSDTTISTITLQASEPDSGTITFSITNGTLPTGLSLSGADIDGTTTLETADTLYTFTVTATDDESQATPRTFTITVKKELISSENFTINTYTGNGSTQAIEGKIGTAASFNGSSSYINLGNASSLVSTDFTFSAWVKTTSTSTIFLISSAVNPYYSKIGVRSEGDGRLRCVYGNYTSNEGNFYSTFNTINNGNWHHVVYFINQTTAKLYINGSLDTTHTLTVTPTINGNLEVGSLYNTGASSRSSYWDGAIDQVRIFNKELSSSEVTTLYGENNTSTTKSTTDIFDDGSGVALYEFEKGANDTGGVSGYIGNGGIFNGVGGNGISTNLITSNTQDLTWSLWVKGLTHNQSATANSIFTHYKDNYAWLNFNSNGTITGRHRSSANVDVDVVSGVINSTVWTHVVFVSSLSGGNKIYINGGLIDSNTTSITSRKNDVNAGTGLYIGNNPADLSGPYALKGQIDQIRIFNKALSSSEVTTLYGETSASATKSTADIFDDSSGVALYELEGNANDSGRFGSGAIDSGQSGVFNGSSSYIDLGSTIDNPLRTEGAFGASFWFNADSYGSNSVIFKLLNDTYIYIFLNTSNQLECRVVNSSDVASIITFGVSLNTWYHIVWTGNSTNGVTLYVNGSSIGNTAWDGTFLTYTNTTYKHNYLGYNGGNVGWYNGSIDQVRIYNTALSSSDVVNLVSETNVPTTNLVAHYKLDGNANDETGTYNGTASNITYSDPAEFPTYNGTATNVSYAYDGTPTNVSFVGTSFQPDLVWIKERNNPVDHLLFDTIRGAGVYQRTNLATNEPSPQLATLSSFDSNGFSVGTDGGVNGNNDTYVAWMWKAGGAAVSNTDGVTSGSVTAVTSQVSSNTDAGFSICEFTTPSSGKPSWGHGLNTSPDFIILKRKDAAQDWFIYLPSVLGQKELRFTAAAATSYSQFLSVDSSKIDLGSASFNISANANYIAYCFHSVDGYQSVGSYTGNGSTTGPIITTGFKPRFILTKPSSIADNWSIWDNVRETGDTIDQILVPNNNGAESADGFGRYDIDLLDNGFQIKRTDSQINQNGATYIYLAIA